MEGKLKRNHLVVKQNAVNEMRTHDMTLQELRLFTIYLSKINPKDQKTKKVSFKMSDFQAIMELRQMNIPYFKRVADSLIKKLVFQPLDNGGFQAFPIFSWFKVAPNEKGEWQVDIDINEYALPLLFDFKGHFFKYELWNALRLKSKNQLRMYEILKQYEGIGYRVLSVKELKSLLGIEENEYNLFKNFRQDVLEVCKKSLSQNTDISFDYEPYGKKGRGGKIIELKFTVTKNKDFKDPLSLEKFIDLKSQSLFYNYEEEYEEQEEQEHEQLELDDREEYIDTNDLDENGLVRATGRHPVYEERITYLMDACLNEFNRDEVVVLFDEIRAAVPHIYEDELHSHDYLQRKYREMVMRRPATSRLGYLRKLIAQDKR